MYLIDTNIFIELLLNQEKANYCEEFLQRTGEGEFNCIVTSFTVHAVEGLLTENPETIEDFIQNIKKSIGIKVVETSLEEEKEIAAQSKNNNLDFDDSLQLSVARKKDVQKIVSLDEDFENTELERMEPHELL